MHNNNSIFEKQKTVLRVTWMYFKKQIIITIFLVYCVILGAAPAIAAEPPEITGETAVLMDAQNFQVLYDKDMHKRMYPASTTKILTGIIAVENGEMSDLIRMSWEAIHTEGTHIGLQEGEQLTLKDLLYALLLNSANDAAEGIAEHYGKSVEKFSTVMNKKAVEIGAVHSNFVNPHGLPEENHYTTAYDLALIGQYAMQNEKFREIVKEKTMTISRADPDAQKYLANHNKLLWNYDGTIGIKSGYTVSAGQCIVAEVKRNDRELIAVVLKSDGSNIWSDAEKLFDYGFDNFQNLQLVNQGQMMCRANVNYGAQNDVSLVTAKDFSWNLPADQRNTVQKKLVLNKNIKAPIKKGQKLGEVVFIDGDRELAHVDLLAQNDISRKIIRQWWVWTLVAGVVGIFSLWLWINDRRKRKMVYIRRRRPRGYIR